MGERQEQTLTFAERILNPDVYYFPNVDWDFIIHDLEETVTLSNSRKVRYFQTPISFDIETTSFLSSQLEKCATMYAWGCSINGHVILGRTWEEFDEVYDKLIDIFSPTPRDRIIIYIQNLAYEFQFMCHRFNWKKVFALKERKPIYALTTENVEFRCSYLLSGFSLAKMGENLQRYKVTKKVGDLDYSLMRHSKTPLTSTEWKYIIDDVQVVVAYIQECFEDDGGFNKIPLTKTGYVRTYCREQCFKDKYYRYLMNTLTLDYEEYRQLKRAFQGGFTHANWRYARDTIENMDSFDFTSSYPYAMVSEKYPMSKSEIVHPKDEDEFRYYLSKYCCLFDAEFTNIYGWDAPDHIISKSKCSVCKGEVLNNGRIIYADLIVTTITEIDFESYEKFYKWDNLRVTNFRIYKKEYLPPAFIEAILKLYRDKTELKGVEGKEVEYMKSKGMVNSAYGMCVTDIVRDEDTFIDEWTTEKCDGETAISKYNSNKNRFLFYPWGIWVTAYARRNLFTAIYEFQDDYVYSDTDSIKGINADKHKEYFERYNATVERKLKVAAAWRNFDIEATRPKTIKGEEKPLGIWEHDAHYTRFKTLGAKRYMTEENGKVSITVAGLAKTEAVPYMKKLASAQGKDLFEIFDNGLFIPGEHTGKSVHTYNDNEFSSQLEDYLGNTSLVHEYSSIHLAPAEYSLSLDDDYIRLIGGMYFTDG